MIVVGWKAWYADGAVIESVTGSLSDCLALPRTKLILWMLRYDETWIPGKHYHRDMGNDFYGFRLVDEQVEYTGFNGDLPAGLPRDMTIIEGELVSNQQYAFVAAKGELYLR